MENEAVARGAFAQTLSRGIRVLEVLAAAAEPKTLRAVADELQLPRSVVYRLLKTLESHRLVHMVHDDSYDLAPGLLALARSVGTDVRTSCRPVLLRAAEEFDCTAILSVVDGDDIVCLVSVESERSGVKVSYREGRRHRLGQGSSGIAILAAQPPQPGQRRAIARARQAGYAVSDGEIASGTVAASAPVSFPAHDWIGAVSLLFVTGSAPRPADAGAAAKRLAAEVESAVRSR